MAAPPAIYDITALVPSWTLYLRSERKSPKTIKSYVDGVSSYVKFCDANGQARAFDRRQVQAWTCLGQIRNV
jgi:hypothetical protein